MGELFKTEKCFPVNLLVPVIQVSLSSSLSVRSSGRLQGAFSVMDSLLYGSSISMRSLSRLSSGISVVGDFWHSGSGGMTTTALLSVKTAERMGSKCSVFQESSMGSSLSIRSLSRFGSTTSVLAFLNVGSMLSLRDVARLGSSFKLAARAVARQDFSCLLGREQADKNPSKCFPKGFVDRSPHSHDYISERVHGCMSCARQRINHE